jgi:hypothetical protein
MKSLLTLIPIALLSACGKEAPPPPHKPPMPSMNPAQSQVDALNKSKTVEGTLEKGAEQRKGEDKMQTGY